MAYNERSLDDYIDVAQRIADFREKYPEGTLQPYTRGEAFRLVQAMGWDKDGTQVMQSFVVVVAAAYRDREDPNPGVGMAWEIFPGRTPYTRGSELQNAETSAWGRAIVAVGASDSKRGIASREEVRNRQAERAEGQSIEGISYCGPCGHPKHGEHCGFETCECLLVWNKDGSLSRRRTTDEQKAAAGVMTDAEQRAHNQLAKPPPNTGKVERFNPNRDAELMAEYERQKAVDAAVDDRWTSDAPSWLVGVDPPEDQPGTISEAQSKQIHAVYSALKITDREARLTDVNRVLGLTTNQVASSKDLSFQQAARLLENLHERHTGKMTRR